MKRLFCVMLMLILTIGVGFSEKIHVEFEVYANELTELQADFFIHDPQSILLMAVNPDSIQEGFIVDYEDKSTILSFKPPDLFDGQTTFEYYFIDKNLRDYNVIAHVNVEYPVIDVINKDIKQSCEKLILSDVKEEYKHIYKQIIDLIMQMEPLE